MDSGGIKDENRALEAFTLEEEQADVAMEMDTARCPVACRAIGQRCQRGRSDQDSRMGINQPYGYYRISLTIISMMSSYAQAALILVGSLELFRSKAFSRKHLIILNSAIALASVVMVLLRHADPDGRTFRYVVRVGLKYLVVSIVFFVTAGITINHNRFVGGIGQRIMALGFISYALINFYYAFIVFYNAWITEYDFPMFFGLIEL